MINKKFLAAGVLLIAVVGTAGWFFFGRSPLPSASVTKAASAPVATKQVVVIPAKQPSDDACFKPKIEKKMDDVSWRVSTCEHDGSVNKDDVSMNYKVEYRKGNAAPLGMVLKYAGDYSSMVGESEELLASDTLLINMEAENGGHAFLLHVKADGNSLSSQAFDYQSAEDAGLHVAPIGNTLHAESGGGVVVFAIDAAGNLVREDGQRELKTCKKEDHKKGGASFDYTLKVEKKADRIVTVSYSGSSSTGDEGGASFCDFTAASDDPKAKFTQEGSRTMISADDNGTLSKIVVDENKSQHTMTVTLDVPQMYYCGAHAQVPSKITLRADNSCAIEN